MNLVLCKNVAKWIYMISTHIFTVPSFLYKFVIQSTGQKKSRTLSPKHGGRRIAFIIVVIIGEYDSLRPYQFWVTRYIYLHIYILKCLVKNIIVRIYNKYISSDDQSITTVTIAWFASFAIAQFAWTDNVIQYKSLYPKHNEDKVLWYIMTTFVVYKLLFTSIPTQPQNFHSFQDLWHNIFRCEWTSVHIVFTSRGYYSYCLVLINQGSTEYCLNLLS